MESGKLQELDQSVSVAVLELKEASAGLSSAVNIGEETTGLCKRACCRYLKGWRCSVLCVTSLRQYWFAQEVIRLTSLAVPLFFMGFSQQLFCFLTLLLVGHSLGSTELGAVALAQSFAAVTGRSMLVGLSSAADTLCSQSYGFKNYKRVGIIFQRGVLVLGVTSFSIAAIWMVSDSISLLLQQDSCVVQLSTQYLRLRILALPFMLLYIMLERYLQSQSLVWIFVGIGFLQNIVGMVFNALFLYATHLGVVGVSLSLLLFDALGPVLLISYIKWRGLHSKTWGGWSWESLRGWSQFLKFGVSGYLMIAFEWWAYEITILVTGSISQEQLAASTIIYQFAAVAYMTAFGFGTAVAIRVGNELGAGNPLAAKRAALTSIILELVIGVTIMVVFLSTRNVIGRVFTNNEAVLEILSPALLASLGVLGADQLQGVTSGVLRGAGRQVLGAITNFICYYVLGLPLGVCLALLVDLGAVGMWIGVSAAGALQVCTFLVYILTSDWKKLSDKAVRNAGGQCKVEGKQDDEQMEADGDEGGEKSGPTAVSLSADDIQPNDDEIEPLMSEEESDVDETELMSKEEPAMAEVSYGDRKTTRGHKAKLLLLLSKGSVIIVSGSVLIVGAVLAGLVHYDYSTCESEEMSQLLPTVLPATRMPSPTPT